MPTTSQILGLTPQEKAAAIFTAAGEAGPGRDALGVLQTIISRKALSGGNIANLVKAPQQFVANDPYTLQQVVNPEYGRKVHGSRYQQIEQMFEDPSQMVSALQAGQGATQFRGQALLSKKQKGDIMFDPKGNFYFQKNPDVAKSLSDRLIKGGGGAPVQQAAPGRTFIILSDEEKSPSSIDFLGDFIKTRPELKGLDVGSMLASAFQAPNYLEDQA